MTTVDAWPPIRLKYTCRVNPTAPRVTDQQSVSFVPMESVGERGGLTLRETRTAGDVKQGYTGFRDGDVLVAKITPCFENGKGAIAEGLLGGVGFGTTELHVVRPMRADRRWVFYVTQSTQFMGLGEGSMYGAGGQKRVPPEFVRNFAALTPPLPTQRAIAAYLDRKTAAIDALIEKKQTLLVLLAEKRAALINQAVTKGLDPHVPMKDSGVPWIGEVPAHWEVKRLKFVCTLETGHTPSRSEPSFWIEEECVIPWVSLNDTTTLKRTDYIEDTTYRISALGMAHSAAHLIPEGSVVFTRDATIGLTAILKKPMAVSQHIIGWVCGPDICNEFLLHVLGSMSQELDRLTFGATLKTIGMADVRELATPVPPVEQQEEIVRYVTDERDRMDRARERLNTQLDRLREYRQALITAAVTGQLHIGEDAA